MIRTNIIMFGRKLLWQLLLSIKITKISELVQNGPFDMNLYNILLAKYPFKQLDLKLYCLVPT